MSLLIFVSSQPTVVKYVAIGKTGIGNLLARMAFMVIEMIFSSL
jgi:hypothetical protein